MVRGHASQGLERRCPLPRPPTHWGPESPWGDAQPCPLERGSSEDVPPQKGTPWALLSQSGAGCRSLPIPLPAWGLRLLCSGGAHPCAEREPARAPVAPFLRTAQQLSRSSPARGPSQQQQHKGSLGTSWVDFLPHKGLPPAAGQKPTLAFPGSFGRAATPGLWPCDFGTGSAACSRKSLKSLQPLPPGDPGRFRGLILSSWDVLRQP